MPPSRALVALIALLLLAAVVAPSHAGWGDALKQNAAKLTKSNKSKPAAETGPVQSRMTPAVTAETLARFQRGMEVEVAEREKSKQLLASLPKKEDRDKCAQQLAMSPEMQKITMDYAESAANAKPEDQQKLTERWSQRMDSLITGKCGPDPGKYNPQQMERDALAKGSDAAALGDDNAYHAWKEWVIEFCKYIEKLQKEPDAKEKLAKMKDEGLRIPGVGSGIYFVYSASEVALLLELCPKLKPLIEATI